MHVVFADTGYWIALASGRDELRPTIVDTTESLDVSIVVTTEMVLVEFLNHMSRGGEYAREVASDMMTGLLGDPDVEIVPQTTAQFSEALSRYATRLDQRWSLTDCASFLVMEERGITEALAYDRDFEQAGFVALLRGNRE